MHSSHASVTLHLACICNAHGSTRANGPMHNRIGMKGRPLHTKIVLTPKGRLFSSSAEAEPQELILSRSHPWGPCTQGTAGALGHHQRNPPLSGLSLQVGSIARSWLPMGSCCSQASGAAPSDQEQSFLGSQLVTHVCTCMCAYIIIFFGGAADPNTFLGGAVSLMSARAQLSAAGFGASRVLKRNSKKSRIKAKQLWESAGHMSVCEMGGGEGDPRIVVFRQTKDRTQKTNPTCHMPIRAAARFLLPVLPRRLDANSRTWSSELLCKSCTAVGNTSPSCVSDMLSQGYAWVA